MVSLDLQLIGSEAPVSVRVDKTEESEYLVEIDAETYQLKLHWESEHEGWAYNVKTAEVIPFYIWVNGEELYLWMAGRIYRFLHISQEVKRSKSRDRKSFPVSGEIKAPMPGTVLKILVEAGDKVEANAPLLIMESMKMEMTLTAPANAWVTGITCKVGELVDMNSLLIQLEAVEDELVLS